MQDATMLSLELSLIKRIRYTKIKLEALKNERSKLISKIGIKEQELAKAKEEHILAQENNEKIFLEVVSVAKEICKIDFEFKEAHEKGLTYFLSVVTDKTHPSVVKAHTHGIYPGMVTFSDAESFNGEAAKRLKNFISKHPSFAAIMKKFNESIPRINNAANLISMLTEEIPKLTQEISKEKHIRFDIQIAALEHDVEATEVQLSSIRPSQQSSDAETTIAPPGGAVVFSFKEAALAEKPKVDDKKKQKISEGRVVFD